MSATKTISILLRSVDSIITVQDLTVIFGITGHDLLYSGEKDGPGPIWQSSQRSWNFALIILRKTVGLSVPGGGKKLGIVP